MMEFEERNFVEWLMEGLVTGEYDLIHICVN